MKLGLIIFLIVGVIVLNIYYDGQLFNKVMMYKKYYKMVFYIFLGLGVYLFINKNPNNYRDLVINANSYLKYLPIDRNTQSFISPIIDFTNKSMSNEIYNTNNQFADMTSNQMKILTSGTKSNKRSVSETKKKFVASNQNWCCKHCSRKLPAWFEVDHVVKLEYGGSNGIDNLEALCRDCHGKKTALENL